MRVQGEYQQRDYGESTARWGLGAMRQPWPHTRVWMGGWGPGPQPSRCSPERGSGSCALARMRWLAHPWCPGLLQVSCSLGMTLSRV